MTDIAELSESLQKRFARIRCLCLDVDGVLTDGRIHVLANGDEFASFDVHDGLGIVQLLKEGFVVAAISGRNSPPARLRLQDLGVTHIHLGVSDKLQALSELTQTTGIEIDRIAHVGDDVPDLALFNRVGLRISVTNAMPQVKTKADYVTRTRGGRGAVREICDMLISARRFTRS